MDWENKYLKILGLTGTETSILGVLTTAKSIQMIAEDTSLSRTGVNYALKKLIGMKLVTYALFGRRKLYSSITAKAFSQKLKNILGEIEISSKDKKGTGIRVSKESQFTIHVGIKEVVEAYSRIASTNQNTRIKAIQGYKSWITIVEKLSPNELVQFNQSIRENHLIIDGILQENQYARYADYLKKHPGSTNTASAKSLTGRMADYTAIPSNFFDVFSEIWIFKNTVIIINWNEEVAIEITNQEMMAFLRDMFEFVKIGGKKVNHEEEMEKILMNIDLNTQ